MPTTSLLDLPVELLLHILYRLDPDSFCVILSVCKTIQKHVLGCNQLVRHQLRKLPGRQDSLAYQGSRELINTFHRRSQRHLKHGVEVFCDISRFNPGYRIDSHESVLMPCSCRTSHTLLAAVFPEDASVRLYSIRMMHPSLICILGPDALGYDDHDSEGPNIRWEVLKVSFFDGTDRSCRFQCHENIAVLYRYHILNDNNSQFGKEAQTRAKGILKLVTYKFDESFEPKITHVRDIHVDSYREVTSLGVAEDGTAVIAFQTPEGSPKICDLVSYQNSYSHLYDRFPTTSRVQIEVPDAQQVRPISKVEILGPRVHLYEPGFPVPQCYVDDYALKRVEVKSAGNNLPNDYSLPFTGPSLGVVLQHQHVHNVKDIANNEEYCLNTALIAALSRAGRNSGAYLIKAVHYPDSHEHFEPNRRYPTLEYHFAAKLKGMDLEDIETQSSLGVIMAVSPGGARIAMATWKRILVWTVYPAAFLNVEMKGPDPGPKLPPEPVEGEDPMDGVESSALFEELPFSDDLPPDDHAYLERCGHDYYQCYRPNGDEEVIAIEPVELPTNGVVFSLAFHGNDALWGLTDKGIVRWGIGPACQGRRHDGELDLAVYERAGFRVEMNGLGGVDKGKGRERKSGHRSRSGITIRR